VRRFRCLGCGVTIESVAALAEHVASNKHREKADGFDPQKVGWFGNKSVRNFVRYSLLMSTYRVP
jgi:hypothetical protein